MTTSKRSIRAPSSRPLRMPPLPTTTQRWHLCDLCLSWCAESERGNFRRKERNRSSNREKISCLFSKPLGSLPLLSTWRPHSGGASRNCSHLTMKTEPRQNQDKKKNLIITYCSSCSTLLWRPWNPNGGGYRKRSSDSGSSFQRKGCVMWLEEGRWGNKFSLVLLGRHWAPRTRFT